LRGFFPPVFRARKINFRARKNFLQDEDFTCNRGKNLRHCGMAKKKPAKKKAKKAGKKKK